MDFTIRKYVQLLNKLAEKGYVFQTFEYFIEHSYESKIVVLRHDVDRNPENALRFAFIENKLGIKASYYFRIGRKVFKEDIIKKIVTLGHEVGYHYEDLTICKGIFENAIIHFGRQLASFRTIYPVRTICMHGSPLSKWDNRKLWERYDYHNYGIIAEPYFDVDYSKVYYITDTGRAWNNRKSSIRDKVKIFFKIRIQDTIHYCH